MATARGSYALVLALNSGTDIAVGALGPRYFPPGCYVYVGSALGGLFSRFLFSEIKQKRSNC